MIRQIEAGEVQDPSRYLKTLETQISLEDQLRLGIGPERFYYQANRPDIGSLLIPEIEEMLTENIHVDVIEIGGGEGKGIGELLKRFRRNSGVSFSITGLTLLPEYQGLSERGVSVYSGVLVENLPREWTEKFDVVGTSFIFGYTDVNPALRGVQRILKPGGIWIGLEGYNTVNAKGEGIAQRIQEGMDSLYMQNNTGFLGFAIHLAGGTIFKHIKP